MAGGSIYPAPDEIEGLPVASKHIVLTRHALVVSFYQNKVFLSIFSSDISLFYLYCRGALDYAGCFGFRKAEYFVINIFLD